MNHRSLIRRLLLVTIAFCAACAIGLPKPSESPVSEPATPSISASIPASIPPIWAELQQGQGQVVLLRHAQAPGTGDPANFQLDDCSTQRNLSAEGRSQAAQIGETFRSYDVPVSRVLSSQWCRCLETAELLNLGAVEPFPALNSFFADRSQEAQQTANLRQFVLQHQDEAGVAILVTHQVNITALTGVVPQSGAAVVLRGQADQIESIGQLSTAELLPEPGS